MQKKRNGLTDEQLTQKINEVGEEIEEERENPNISQAIVDDYLFSIDRTLSKILDYIGKESEIIITAKITRDLDGENPVVTVTGALTYMDWGEGIKLTADPGWTDSKRVFIKGIPLQEYSKISITYKWSAGHIQSTFTVYDISLIK